MHWIYGLVHRWTDGRTDGRTERCVCVMFYRGTAFRGISSLAVCELARVEGEWRASGGRVEGEWRASGGRVLGEPKEA